MEQQTKRGFVVEIDKIKGLADAAALMLESGNTAAARLILSGLLSEIEYAELRGVKMPRDRRKGEDSKS